METCNLWDPELEKLLRSLESRKERSKREAALGSLVAELRGVADQLEAGSISTAGFAFRATENYPPHPEYGYCIYSNGPVSTTYTITIPYRGDTNV